MLAVDSVYGPASIEAAFTVLMTLQIRWGIPKNFLAIRKCFCAERAAAAQPGCRQSLQPAYAKSFTDLKIVVVEDHRQHGRWPQTLSTARLR
jgi:hypothetical protein